MTTTDALLAQVAHTPDDRALPQRRRRRLVVASLVVTLVTAFGPLPATAQTPADPAAGGYVTTTTVADRSLDVSAFSPECIRDAPFINFTIVPVGFTPVDGTATLVIRDRIGAVVETRTVTSLSGTFIYPGARVDANGNAIDWPGWQLADDGVSWIPDPSDAILRDGLTIEVTVNPTATATVSYPSATSPCANPPGSRPPCVPGQNADGTPADDCEPCVPGQNNDANPADDCTLPRTGSGPQRLMQVGAVVVMAGLLLYVGTRRRRRVDLA
jgi:LPXTG-motif cell wall-anchored protein